MSAEPTANSHEQIANRAYELWEARGRPQDDGVQDWIAAERELAAGSRPNFVVSLKKVVRSYFVWSARKAG